MSAKRLFVIRHAKSSWKDESLKDVERPLKKRGKTDAALIGEELKKRGVAFDQVITSHAKRAKQTCKLVLHSMDCQIKPTRNEHLYFEGAEAMVKVVTEEGETDSQSIAIFSHNPDCSDLARLFGAVLSDDVPTAAVISLSFKCDSWKEICKDNCSVGFVLTPKMLK